MLLISSAPGGIFAIVIYNSNSARDDNFKVLLNGDSNDIGHINNNSNALTGRIFADADHYLDFPASQIATPNPNVFETTLSLDMSLLVTGTNNLKIESIQDNGNGNAGVVKVGYWSLDNTGKLALDTPALLDSSYSMASGVGSFNTYTFNFP